MIAKTDEYASNLLNNIKMVMKYYPKKCLPLYKKSNKYYINRNDLYEWIEGIFGIT